ncbi:hypothetical protein, partial [Staphylococcus haemolyticus]|uniref:hypothetical protein n=1 Tax=Staphylococcus haemolyticus TaxID=1283 RepID=UPI0028A4E09B
FYTLGITLAKSWRYFLFLMTFIIKMFNRNDCSNFSKYCLKIKNKGILICNKVEYKKELPFKI